MSVRFFLTLSLAPSFSQSCTISYCNVGSFIKETRKNFCFLPFFLISFYLCAHASKCHCASTWVACTEKHMCMRAVYGFLHLHQPLKRAKSTWRLSEWHTIRIIRNKELWFDTATTTTMAFNTYINTRAYTHNLPSLTGFLLMDSSKRTSKET